MSGFRVVLDIDRIAADLCVAEERPFRASEVHDLLRRLGFIAIERGQAWLTTSHCLSLLTSRIGPNAQPYMKSSSIREIKIADDTDELVELETAWQKLSPTKRQKILETIRGN